MEQQEYGRYLLAMGGDEFDPEDDEEVEADHFYGLFQWFMPTGAGLNEYLNRFQTVSVFWTEYVRSMRC